MEISPITGIRAMPVMKSPPVDPELTALFDIENTARTGDETYSPSAAKSARGAEDDGSEDEFDDLADEDEVESTRQPAGKNPSRQISFFA
jgi:hypothetical protein